MPTINKPKKKSTYVKHTVTSKAYNSDWKKLRDSYLMISPLCEMCLLEDKTTPTEEIHHVKPLSTAKDELEMMELLLDSNNLMALCKNHHHQIHNELRKRKN